MAQADVNKDGKLSLEEMLDDYISFYSTVYLDDHYSNEVISDSHDELWVYDQLSQDSDMEVLYFQIGVKKWKCTANNQLQRSILFIVSHCLFYSIIKETTYI